MTLKGLHDDDTRVRVTFFVGNRGRDTLGIRAEFTLVIRVWDKRVPRDQRDSTAHQAPSSGDRAFQDKQTQRAVSDRHSTMRSAAEPIHQSNQTILYKHTNNQKGSVVSVEYYAIDQVPN